jgi:hypothetical protein
MLFDLQPELDGRLIQLRPLRKEDTSVFMP